MFKNYVKIAFRHLWKNRSYSLINILGLSIGLTVCLLIFLLIRYELSFDNFHKNSNSIYRVVTTWEYPGRMEYSQGIPLILPGALQQDFPDIAKVAPVIRSGSQITIPEDGGQSSKKFNESGNIFVVGPQFYEIFNFPWIAGNPETALAEPNSVALTQSMAEKFFGDWHQAMGKSILIDNEQPVKVTGIIKDLPANTDLPVQIAVSYATYVHDLYPNWQFVSTESHCYILLKKHTTIAHVESELPAFVKKYYPDNNVQTGLWGFAFQPLRDIHFSTRMGAFGNQIEPKELIALGIVGLFILIIACINFVNMSTAQASKRSKEVGIRKVMGSRRKNLMLQFVGETMLITFFSMLLACVITTMVLPMMNNFFGQPISFDILKYPVIILFIITIVLVTGLLAGVYPALIMSDFNPVTALKSKVSASGNYYLRKALIVVQFSVTIIILAGMWVIVKQVNFFRNKPMGFNQSAISLISLPDDSASVANYNTFRNRLAQLPGIKSVSLCCYAPSSTHFSTTYFTYNRGNRKSFDIYMKYADTGYFRTFGLQLIAGRIFYPSDTMKEAVVNQTLLKKLKVHDPNEAIGKPMTINGHNVTIVGVVKDFVNFSLKDKISPIAITTDKDQYGTLALKLNPVNMESTLQSVKSDFNQLFPAYIYQSKFFDQQIARYYITEDKLAELFKVFTGIVILISVTGLLSLLSFITAQRTKEIAIRKVMGASLKDILQLIGKDFIFLVIIANVIAIPVTVILARQWLDGFANRINLSVWPFAIIVVLSVASTIMMVSLQVMHVARANPVKGLQYE